MKIRGHGEVGRELDQVRQQSRRDDAAVTGPQASRTSKSGQEDTIAVELAREIAGISSSRTERIEELKLLIARGEYKPSSLEVAGAVDSALSEEVLFEKIQNG